MAALVLLPSGATQAVEAEAESQAPTSEAGYRYRFLSSPDFLNADIGNTRESPLYRPGDPNSTNHRYERALDTVLSNFAAEYEPGAPRDIFVAGDLVNGHWGIDTDSTGIFGPTNSHRQRVKAIRRAGKLYYGQWMDRFEERHMTPYAALGDHEIGDNPWGGPGGGVAAWYNEFKARAIPVFKDTFSDHVLKDSRGRYISSARPAGPAHGTAYAVRPHPEVQLVTLDVFQRKGHTVTAELDHQQLHWLRKVLSTANQDGVDWIIVQGHTPIVGPVRMTGSSGLMYTRGAGSSLWKLLREMKVDLYLAGEVHDITAHQPMAGGPVQISHGGLFAYGGTNYMVADITDTTLEITMKSFRHRAPANIREHRMWQTDNTRVLLPSLAPRSVPGWVHYDREPFVSGRMTLTKDGIIVSREGKLGIYKGTP